MTNEPESLRSGTSIDGYTLGDQLFIRSGACTYNAVDPEGRELWFTVYAPTCFPSALVRERSLRELRQLMTVQSKQVLRVLNVGKLEDGGIYEVTERVAGTSLIHKSGKLDRKRVVTLLSDIGQALLAAQKVGVIHRNLGPESVLDTGDGVKVCSFAVAEPQGGSSFGPLSTMAPEQVAGKVVDQRSMVYNLAALGHRLLSGQDLYSGKPSEVLAAHLEAEVPPEVDAVLAKGLAKDPQRRPMMLKQFVDDLGALSPDAEDKGAGREGDAASSTSQGAKPSTRGWTQFMEEEDMGDGPSKGEASSSAPSPSASQSSASKPSTRGWTLFMEGDGAEPEKEEQSAEAPAEEEKIELGAGQSSSSGKKPSTRGWTMFMDAPEGASEEEGDQETPKSSSKAEPKAEEVNTEVRPLPKIGSDASSASSSASKPKTRGWTMFMEGDGEEAKPSASPAASSASASKDKAPAASEANTSTKVSPGSGAKAPSAGASTSKNLRPAKTRGWTMFMDQPAAKTGPAKPDASASAAKSMKNGAAGSLGTPAEGQSNGAPRMAAKPPTPMVSPSPAADLGAAQQASASASASQRKAGLKSKTPPRTLDLSGVSGLHPRPKFRERKTDELAALSSASSSALANPRSQSEKVAANSEKEGAAKANPASESAAKPTPAPLPSPSPARSSAYEGFSLTQIVVVAALVGVVLAGLVLVVVRALSGG